MNNKKEFWNKRATLGIMAGTNDILSKQLEIDEILSYIYIYTKQFPINTVLDFGCGNGITLVELAKKFTHTTFLGIDFSEKMIEEGKKIIQENKLENRVNLICGNHNILENLTERFDIIYSERALINLNSWEEQRKTILQLVSLLNDNGQYLMCECSLDGLNLINNYREALNLSKIIPPWHNTYFEDSKINELAQTNEVKLKEISHFSSTYYFLSRVINAKFAQEKNEEPDYNAPINQLALKLPSINTCGQGKIWVWTK